MTTIDQAIGHETLGAEAYERVKSDLAALRPEQLIRLNLDVPSAVATVLGVLPKLRAQREHIVAELPSFDIARFDKLEDYAFALKHTHADVLLSTQPPDDLQTLTQDAIQLRGTLLADAHALAKHGLLDEKPLRQLKGVNGYKNVAQDLDLLSELMLASWVSIEGKSATVRADLRRASRLSTRLLRIVGLRGHKPANLTAAHEQRARAFTQLLLTYEDARRAVQFLRSREGDASSIAPSLYPGRPRRRMSATSPMDSALPSASSPEVASSVPDEAPAALPNGVHSESRDPFLT